MCLARLLLGETLHGRNSLWAKPAATVSISGHVQILNAFSSIFFHSERLPLQASRGKMRQRTHFSSK